MNILQVGNIQAKLNIFQRQHRSSALSEANRTCIGKLLMMTEKSHTKTNNAK